jgi:predicted phage terminase large subunit-like protein
LSDLKTKIDELTLLRESIRRKAAKGSFVDFIYYIKTDYTAKWFHIYIAEKLQNFLNDKTKQRLMVFMPPQHGKSELTSRLFPAYALGINPNLKIACASYSIDLARSFNREVQRYIDNDYYRDIFPETKINSKNVVTTQSWLRNSEEVEIIDKKGSYKAIGVMGGLSGRPVDLAIIDDPIKDRLEAESQTYRDRVWDWYVNVLESRLHNGSKVVLIMTRWHEDDLGGRLLLKEPNKWEVIKIPAIREYDDSEIDKRSIGEALWPEKHSIEKLESQKSLDESVFESLYQQNPIAKEGNRIKKTVFQIVDSLPNRTIKSDLFIDGAYTEKTKNDPSGILETKFDASTNTLYIVNFEAQRLELPELLSFLKGYIERIHMATSRYYIEPKASGKSVAQMINKQSKYAIIEIKNHLVNEGKETRFNTSTPYITTGKVKLLRGGWNDAFISQLTGFPKVKHDEAVDLCGYACYEYFHNQRQSMSPIGLNNLI